MKKAVGLVLLFLLVSCTSVRLHRQTTHNIDGIIFLDDSDRESSQSEQSSKPDRPVVNKRSNKKQQEKKQEVRNFKAMDGIIMLDLEDQIAEDPNKPLKPSPRKTEIGKASYYAMELTGRRTASGERYNPNKFTAAHPTLPFGTKVRVTNLYNNSSVIVRINDRGPRVKSRIIDLSYAAAKQLGIIDKGIAEVRVEVIEIPRNW